MIVMSEEMTVETAQSLPPVVDPVAPRREGER